MQIYFKFALSRFMGKPNKKYRKKRKLGSYPSISVIYSITLSLIILGVTGLLFIVGLGYQSELKKEVVLPVYLENTVNSVEIEKIRKLIGAKPYVRRENDNPKIDLVTEKEQYEAYISVPDNNDPYEILDRNYHVFKPYLNIFIDEKFADINHLKTIKKELEQYKEVYLADLNRFREEAIVSVNQNVQFWGTLLVGLSVISLLIIILLINNTIKLAMFSQRFIIRTMQLVGAKSSFIKNPFLIRTAIHGLISGILASIVLYYLLEYIYVFLKNTLQVTGTVDSTTLFIWLGSLCLIGVLIGILSAGRAVSKYLKMSLDDLY